MHSDLSGKFSSPSLSGKRYYITFTDDFSRYTWIYFLNKKSDAFETFKDWKTMAERLCNCTLQQFRSDNGGEYKNSEFMKHFKDECITHQFSVPYMHQQNGVAERLNQSIIGTSLALLFDSGLGKQYWAEACAYTVYLKNRTSHKALNGITPYEALYGKKPDLSSIRRFGCRCFVSIPKEKRNKLEARAFEGIFIG